MRRYNQEVIEASKGATEVQARGKFPKALATRLHALSPPGGFLPLVPSCRVYAERPGDPRQHHARRPSIWALLGAFLAQRYLFSKMGTFTSPDFSRTMEA